MEIRDAAVVPDDRSPHRPATPAPLARSYWPADTSEPVLETTVDDALRFAAATWPDRLALVEGVADPAARRRWAFASLLADAERVARALLARFRPGDHVAVWAPNSPEWLLLEFGAALAGLTLVTVNPPGAGEAGHRLSR